MPWPPPAGIHRCRPAAGCCPPSLQCCCCARRWASAWRCSAPATTARASGRSARWSAWVWGWPSPWVPGRPGRAWVSRPRSPAPGGGGSNRQASADAGTA
ncbi:hypothetical protein G6F61_014819 [Rhizopus arrhizus]|nr:hypothetical protein G6F61_014819 [Rhizopus arrhizus]